MIPINSITNYPNQQMSVIIDDGSSFTLNLYYASQQYGWFIPSLVYGDFTLNGIRVSNNPNMLLQWKNILPFGLACFTKGNREPTLQEDFFSGSSTIYVLSQEEVDSYYTYVQGGALPT